MALTGILLAAGRGRRFDPAGQRNKLLQRLPGGELVVAASARTLLAVFPRVVAVAPPDDGGVGDVLRQLGCEVTVCPDADGGMGLSLAHAIRHSLDAPGQGWLVALGDMPFVAPSTLQALAAAIEEGAAIAAPLFGGRRGNPVAFGARHRDDLLALDGDQGARRLLAGSPVAAIDVLDSGILRDIDSPSDLPA
ncbi:molybdenum cofactor cytidylyltransferase [Massilia sp. UYP32]|uniref:nucleotidyltransferase family protein n=1 Tax=Massilia TaxID=149698 RepID=UPI000D84E1BF|nr:MULTISPECIES: nucleotidyltransferase family protein [Massilia]QYG00995.1 nucleotidyltransferase family protein [Massilia sp. NP310]HAK91122.1 molybdopterin-guanine dinucleotide biosynthesis protein MobA [Massilia timonae]